MRLGKLIMAVPAGFAVGAGLVLLLLSPRRGRFALRLTPPVGQTH